MTISVLLADDQALVRGGFRMILEAQDDIVVVAEAENGVEALAQARAVKPQVILMDIRMPMLDGIGATRRLVAEGVPSRVLVLTTFGEDEVVYHAMKAGASGFLLKTVPPARLIDGVRAVAAGDSILDPTLTRRLIEQFVQRPAPGLRTPDELNTLTERETDVLTLIARGLPNAAIADKLVLSEATVKTHINHLLRKLGLRDRVQAVVLAYEVGLVQPSDGQH